MTANPVESFWDFSVRTYRTSGVPEACMSLQDEFDVDVNMFLYCCWVAARRGEFDAELWNDAIEFSSVWAGQLVKPLRLARTWMKHKGCSMNTGSIDDCMHLREKVKSVEFDAERMQQEILESLTNKSEHQTCGASSLLATIAKNVLRYCRHLGLQIDADVAAEIAVIVVAAFPQFDRQQIISEIIAVEKA